MRDLSRFNITPFESIPYVLKHIKNDLKNETPYHIITANPEIVYEAVVNTEYNKIFNAVDLVVADGIGVSAPLGWKGYQSKRIPGIEVFEALMGDKELGKHGVYLIGAKHEIVTKAAKNLQNKNIQVCGYRDGFFALDEDVISDLADDIKKKNPSIVAVAMGAPRQDIVIELLKEYGINSIVIGVGGAFDVLSGEIKRAPQIICKIKLEWLYRLLGDLRRLPRYKKIFQYFIWLFKG